MAEFVAFNRNAEVRGRAILGMRTALGTKASKILENHQLSNIQPDTWYSQQQWLNALREISLGEVNAMFDFIAIAKEIARNIPLPDGVDSVESVLLRESEVYKANNRNCPGYIESTLIEPKHIQVNVCNPYPHDMMYGIIWGLATRFNPNVVVRYLDNTPCSADTECCVYNVTW